MSDFPQRPEGYDDEPREPFAPAHAPYGQPVEPSQPQQPAGQVPIVIQLPQQKTSKAPWVVAIIALLMVFLLLGSCIATPLFIMRSVNETLTSDLGLSDAQNYALPARSDSIGVYHMTAQISGTVGETPETFRAMLKAAEDDDKIKAVVVRCNCPGGTAPASEEIATYIRDFSKPIVFSVSDLCASGAYMAASQADWIVAMPTSEVGSIGVLMNALDLSGLMEKYGIKVDTIKSAEAKDAGAYYRSLTEEDKARLQKRVDEIQAKFIDIVAEGRKMDRAKVKELADGTTYLGEVAVKQGLIDQVGTYDDALKKAAELAGLEPEKPKVHSLDKLGSPFGINLNLN